jgi:FlaA1/EpsC-like NDP-sugar epimerase
MKVLITGATGTIGKEALVQCLIHPQITSVVAISRRELPAEFMAKSKLKTILIKDFTVSPEATLESIKDADAMIWYV